MWSLLLAILNLIFAIGTESADQPLSNSTYEGCQLPEDAQHREFVPWLPDSNGKCHPYPPGTRVEGSVRVRCEDGYRLQNGTEYFTIVCFEGSWISGKIPECEVSEPLRHADLPPGMSSLLPNGCYLPEEKNNRKYLPLNQNSDSYLWTYKPGSYIDYGTLIKVQCESGYGLSNYRDFVEVYCGPNEEFSPHRLPHCKELCPPLVSDSVYTACSYIDTRTGLNMEVDCHKGMLPTTIARYSCKPGYSEYPCLAKEGVYRRTITCRKDGRWSNILPECKPDSDPESTELVRVGNDTLEGCFLPAERQNRNFYPWSRNKDSEQVTYSPGAKVIGAVEIRCKKGYKFPGNKDQTIIFCNEDFWIPQQIPECREVSPDIIFEENPSPPNSTECIIPKEAHNMIFTPLQSDEYNYGEKSYLPGTSVSEDLRVECEAGYGFPENHNYFVINCYDNQWLPQLPKCLKKCPSLTSNSMYITCTQGSKTVNCSEPMMPRTTVTYLCRPGYSQYPCLAEDGVYDRTLTCSHPGKWSHWLPECKPECGMSRGEGEVIPTVVNGTSAVIGQFPWHVGLYLRQEEDLNKYEYICGGSLISNRIVLTAAHCVRPFSEEDLAVAAGKYYRSWDYEEQYAVKLNVSVIKVPPEYQSVATDYAFDIALLLLSDSLAFNSFILPVCLDIHKDFDISHNATGYVVGWGRLDTEEENIEKNLTTNELEIINNESCKRKLPRTLIFDKFCASKNTGTTVQRGDSGGSITTVFNGLHYIFGIVSLRYLEMSVFTNLTWIAHKSWLDKEIDSFNVI